MPVDPEVQARIARITGVDASKGRISDEERELLIARTFAAVGIDSPAVMAAPAAIYTVDLFGHIVSWNQACTELFGWTEDEVLGEPVPFVARHEMDETLEWLDLLVHGGELANVESTPRGKDGKELHVLTSATMLRDDDGEPIATVCFAIDQSAEREASLAIERAHDKWRSLLMNISDTVTIVNRDGHVRESTSEFSETLGYEPQLWSGRRALELIHPDDTDRAIGLWQRVIVESGVEQRDVLRIQHRDGHYELMEFAAISLLDDPVIDGIVMTTRNVTAQREAESLLAGEAHVLELIAKDAPLDETLPAIARLVESHTDGLAAILLLSADARALEIGAAGSVPAELLQFVRQAPLTPNPYVESFDLRRPMIVEDYLDDPRVREFGERAARFGIRAGWSIPVIENRTDELLGLITCEVREPRQPTEHELEVGAVASHLASIAIERDRWQQALYNQARHNQLTGLPNRSLILEQLDEALARSLEHQTTLAVMFIDLDRFKVVNDSLGHAAGDKLLVRFGGRLANLVRPGDLVGHFGADEFIVILEDITDTDDVRFVANRLDLALSEPFGLEEGEIFLSASIGVAVSRVGAETSEALLQHADAAMFRAKELGRDRMEIFDHEMRTKAVEQLRIDRDLRMAVERGELALHYQPKIDLATGAIVGAEALLRWNHPTEGLVLPERFLAVAEETGIIVRIGRWVLDEAVLQARAWVERVPDLHDLTISVNLSARQISAPGLVEQVARVLDGSQWPPHQLVLELTESILIDDRDAAFDVLTELKHLGVRLAIDDFGTGFSSLNYLHRFPVDVVKIDRSFVTNLREDGDGSPVATAVMHMAHALGLAAAAEGVEEPQQLAGLRALGCDLAQGFLFAEPRPADEIEELLRAHPSW
jgi:diguanylate cyclase (GGDEF)-like protein/PAS domain S-box-containing protein